MKKVGIVLVLDNNNEPQFHDAFEKKSDAIAESERLRENGVFTQWFWKDYEKDGILVNIKDTHFYCGNQAKSATINGFFFKAEVNQ